MNVTLAGQGRPPGTLLRATWRELTRLYWRGWRTRGQYAPHQTALLRVRAQNMYEDLPTAALLPLTLRFCVQALAMMTLAHWLTRLLRTTLGIHRQAEIRVGDLWIAYMDFDLPIDELEEAIARYGPVRTGNRWSQAGPFGPDYLDDTLAEEDVLILDGPLPPIREYDHAYSVTAFAPDMLYGEGSGKYDSGFQTTDLVNRKLLWTALRFSLRAHVVNGLRRLRDTS